MRLYHKPSKEWGNGEVFSIYVLFQPDVRPYVIYQFPIDQFWNGEETRVTTKFKVGDKVRYLGGRDDKYIGIGDIGIVTCVTTYAVRAKWINPVTGIIFNPNGSDNEWNARFDDIELVKETNMKITLPNGAIVEGTVDQINVIAKAYGIKDAFDPAQYYHSDHKGWILIATMDTNHIKNAMLKMYRTWVTNLSTVENTRDLVLQMRNGPSDKTFTALLTELTKRV